MTKKLWILAIVAVVMASLIVAWVLLVRIPDKDDSKKNATEPNTKISLVNVGFDKVKEIEISNSSKFKIQVSHAENGEVSYTIPELDKSKKLSKLNAESTVRVLSALSAKKKVLDKSDKLDDFGLQKPEATVKVISTDGGQVTLYLGKRAPLGDGVYLKKEGDDAIYLIEVQNANNFLDDINSYVEQEESNETQKND